MALTHLVSLVFYHIGNALICFMGKTWPLPNGTCVCALDVGGYVTLMCLYVVYCLVTALCKVTCFRSTWLSKNKVSLFYALYSALVHALWCWRFSNTRDLLHSVRATVGSSHEAITQPTREPA